MHKPIKKYRFFKSTVFYLSNKLFNPFVLTPFSLSRLPSLAVLRQCVLWSHFHLKLGGEIFEGQSTSKHAKQSKGSPANRPSSPLLFSCAMLFLRYFREMEEQHPLRNSKNLAFQLLHIHDAL